MKLFAPLFVAAALALPLTGLHAADKAPAAKAPDVAKGEASYAPCAACHGADGKGNQQIGAPNLTDDIWLHGGTEAVISETIVKGRMNQMPAHKDFLDEGKIHLLTAYVLGLSGQAAK